MDKVYEGAIDTIKLLERLASAEKALEPFGKASDAYPENTVEACQRVGLYIGLDPFRAARAHMEKYHGR